MTISMFQRDCTVQRHEHQKCNAIVPSDCIYYFLYFIKTDIKEQLSSEVLEAVLC